MLSLLVAALVAGPVLRAPVGRGPVGSRTVPADPVRHRVAGLLAGPPVLHRSVAVVPLYASLPSLAGHGKGSSVTWLDRGLQARPLFEGNQSYLRVANPTPHPVLVPAGTLFQYGKSEAFTGRGVVVPANFAALLPAVLRHPRANEEHAPAGRVTPVATGAAMHPEINGDTVASGWHVFGITRLVAIQRLGEIDRPTKTLVKHSQQALNDFGRTAVGAVFLVGNRPISAHVFGRHDLFRTAFADLARAAVIQARQVERAGNTAEIRRAARTGSPVPSALAFLRALQRYDGVTTESYAEGFEVAIRAPLERVVGQALLDRDRSLLHLAYYAVGGYWPATSLDARNEGGRAGGVPGGGPAPKGPPTNPNPEGSPGVTDRRPRPTIAAERQRARRPDPPNPGGGNRGGGNAGNRGGGGGGGGGARGRDG